jgi:hypothetical protein
MKVPVFLFMEQERCAILLGFGDANFDDVLMAIEWCRRALNLSKTSVYFRL